MLCCMPSPKALLPDPDLDTMNLFSFYDWPCSPVLPLQEIAGFVTGMLSESSRALSKFLPTEAVRES